MKKTVSLILLLMFTSISAFALSPEEEKQARYDEMKRVKQTQRETREAAKAAAVSGQPVKKEPGFWEKEAERSGLGGSRARFPNFVKNLNPAPFFKEQQERYKARKAASHAENASDRAQSVASANSAVAANTVK